MEKTICELFAGVGGFRLGFDRLKRGGRQRGSLSGNRVPRRNGLTAVMFNILETVLILTVSSIQAMISAQWIN